MCKLNFKETRDLRFHDSDKAKVQVFVERNALILPDKLTLKKWI